MKSAPVEFSVIDQPKQATKLSTETPPVPLRPLPPPKRDLRAEERAVFGISKNTLTEERAEAGDEVSVKAGNTLAVAPDDKTLEPGDAASLPIPAEEYLVTAMPRLLDEVRIPYPKEAKAKGIEGPVVFDLLIDTEGAVRDVRFLEGPGGGLDEAALEAVRRIRFSPARIEKKTVAVRIRYIYRFVLEK